jgi:NMD protein affecting ribosome stability and mRNA decay
MKRNLVKQEKIELYAPRTEEHEIPKGKSGLIFCKECEAVYYKKSWHHNLKDYKKLKENLPVKFSLCPACQMIKNRQFEGEIIVKNIPGKIKNDLINLAKTFCRRAFEVDPMDRLIAVKEAKEGLRITTTENQLAVRLAKKIKQTFKKVEMKISYSPAPSDVVYIVVEFTQP